MSMYAKYLEERTDDLIIESPYGFVTYRYMNDGETVYIIDIYVEPDHRKMGYASELADIVAAQAKEKGFVKMIGTVAPSAKKSTTSLSVLLSYGMTLDSAGQDLIVFKKDL